MKTHHFPVITGIAVLLTLSLLFVKQPPQISPGNSLNMASPSFVGEVSAASNAIGDRLDEEAGISAYYKSSYSINLNQVRGSFRTIEQETADYIIGSVPVTNYVEHFDAHVYVHKDGWILAYYLNTEPASKIADVKGRTISTTKLKTVVATVASAAGVPFTDVTYYDFRYPNATSILLVAEDQADGSSFNIQVPSSYGYFERGWAMFGRYSNYDFYLDGINLVGINQIYYGDDNYYGTISASQLQADLSHTISVDASVGEDAYGVLVVTYRGQ